MLNVNDLGAEKYTRFGMVLVLTELDVADLWSRFIPDKTPVFFYFQTSQALYQAVRSLS